MKKWIALACGAVVLAGIGVGVGVASASIPATDGTINGCYANEGLSQGQLYVIDSGDSCPTGDSALNWSQGGISGYSVVTDSATAASFPTQTITDDVSCPSGTDALGGGATSEILTESRPLTASGVATGWEATGRKEDPNGGYDVTVSVWAICASVS